MKYLRYLFLALLAMCLVTVALANRGMVQLKLLSADMAAFTGLDWQIELPLFLIVFGGIIAGLLIGFVWEWMREYKHRAEATRAKRDAAQLHREVKRLKTQTGPKDDVLALLDDGRKAG